MQGLKNDNYMDISCCLYSVFMLINFGDCGTAVAVFEDPQ